MPTLRRLASIVLAIAIAIAPGSARPSPAAGGGVQDLGVVVVSHEIYRPIAGENMPLIVITANNGVSTANNAVVTVTLASEAAFVSLDDGLWDSCTSPDAGETGQVECTMAAYPQGATRNITLTVQLPAAPARMAFSAAISFNGTDDNVHNNTSTASVVGDIRASNGTVWDVDHPATAFTGLLGLTNPYDSGGVIDGGQDAFDNWGMLRLHVFDGGGAPLAGPAMLENLGLTYTDRAWHTTNPQSMGGVQVSRALWAPSNTNWLRYVDTFTNTAGSERVVYAAWGGNLGSDDDTTTAGSSSSDLVISAADTWAVTIEQSSFNPAGPAGDGPVGYTLRSAADTTYLGPASWDSSVITATWPTTGSEYLSHVYRVTLAPGESARLAYFLMQGLDETGPGPVDCEFYLSLGGCYTPLPGVEIDATQAEAAALAAYPHLCDLPLSVRATVRNWPGIAPCEGDEWVVFLPLVVKGE